MLVKMLFSLPTIDEQHGSKYYFGCQAMRNSGLEPECFKQTLARLPIPPVPHYKLNPQALIMIDFYIQCQT